MFTIKLNRNVRQHLIISTFFAHFLSLSLYSSLVCDVWALRRAWVSVTEQTKANYYKVLCVKPNKKGTNRKTLICEWARTKWLDCILGIYLQKYVIYRFTAMTIAFVIRRTYIRIVGVIWVSGSRLNVDKSSNMENSGFHPFKKQATSELDPKDSNNIFKLCIFTILIHLCISLLASISYNCDKTHGDFYAWNHVTNMESLYIFSVYAYKQRNDLIICTNIKNLKNQRHDCCWINKWAFRHLAFGWLELKVGFGFSQLIIAFR